MFSIIYWQDIFSTSKVTFWSAFECFPHAFHFVYRVFRTSPCNILSWEPVNSQSAAWFKRSIFRSLDFFFLLLWFDLFINWFVFWGVNRIYMGCLTLEYCSKTSLWSLFVIIRYSLCLPILEFYKSISTIFASQSFSSLWNSFNGLNYFIEVYTMTWSIKVYQ